MPLIDVKPYSVHNPEVKSVSKRDEEVLMGRIVVVFRLIMLLWHTYMNFTLL